MARRELSRAEEVELILSGEEEIAQPGRYDCGSWFRDCDMFNGLPSEEQVALEQIAKVHMTVKFEEWVCTRPGGHAGPHIAHAGDGYRLAVWD